MILDEESYSGTLAGLEAWLEKMETRWPYYGYSTVFSVKVAGREPDCVKVATATCHHTTHCD